MGSSPSHPVATKAAAQHGDHTSGSGDSPSTAAHHTSSNPHPDASHPHPSTAHASGGGPLDPNSPLSASGHHKSIRKDVAPGEAAPLRLSSTEHELLLQTHSALVAQGIDEVGKRVERRFHSIGDDHVRFMLDHMRPEKKKAMFDFVISHAIVTSDFHVLTGNAAAHCGKGIRPNDFTLLHKAVIDECHEILGPEVWTPAVAAAYESAFTRASNLLMGAIDSLDPEFLPSPRRLSHSSTTFSSTTHHVDSKKADGQHNSSAASSSAAHASPATASSSTAAAASPSEHHVKVVEPPTAAAAGGPVHHHVEGAGEEVSSGSDRSPKQPLQHRKLSRVNFSSAAATEVPPAPETTDE